MPYMAYDHKAAGLVCMSAAAKLCGLSKDIFWTAVREKHLINEPATLLGNRRYYDPKQLATVMKQVADLRKKGVIA